MRRGLGALLGAAIVLAGATPTAHASARKRVAILDLVTEGLSGDVRAQFENTIEEHLRRAGYDVVSRAVTAEVVSKRDDLFDGCAFGPCVTPIAVALGVERLLAVRIGAEGTSYNFVISLVEGNHGTSVGQVATTCAVCTVAEALRKVGAMIGSLEGQGIPQRTVDSGPIVRVEPTKRSKLVPILLVVSGLALTGGGTAIVAGTSTKEPGWVTIGSGGTVLLTGLIMLIAGE